MLLPPPGSCASASSLTERSSNFCQVGTLGWGPVEVGTVFVVMAMMACVMPFSFIFSVWNLLSTFSPDKVDVIFVMRVATDLEDPAFARWPFLLSASDKVAS